MERMQVLALLAPTQSVSTVDAKWLQAVPGEGRIKATGRGIPMSLITEGSLCGGKPGKIRRWEQSLVCSANRARTRPRCKPLRCIFI